LLPCARSLKPARKGESHERDQANRRGTAHEQGGGARQCGLYRRPGGGKDKGGSVADQTREILALIDALLDQAGSAKAKILSATIYLSDIATFSEMNGVWDAWVDKDNPPARATVEAKLVSPDYKVEIAVIAAL
jgi:enamine deaminase RidA (YjgF/YER057c/UK114 family)